MLLESTSLACFLSSSWELTTSQGLVEVGKQWAGHPAPPRQISSTATLAEPRAVTWC